MLNPLHGNIYSYLVNMCQECVRIRTTNSYLNGMQTYVSVPRHKFHGM